MLSYQSLLGLSSLDSDSISTKDLDISGNLIVEGTTTLNILNVTSASIASLYAATGTFDNLIVRNQFTYNTGAQHGYILSCTGNTGTGLWIENNPSMTGDCTGNTLSNRVDTLAGGTINVTDLVTLTGTQTVINKDMTVDAFRLPTGGALNKVLTSDATGQASWQTNVTEVTMGGDISGLSSASVVNTLAGGTIDCLDLVTENATQYMNNKTMTGTSNIIAANILRASDNAWNIGLTGSAPVFNQILTYGSDGGYWSDLNLITGPTGPIGSTSAIIYLNGNCTGPSNAVICLGASGPFNVVGRTTTAGLTNSLGTNFSAANTKMIALTDLGTTTTLTQTNYDGFGASSNTLRYQTKDVSTNHVFYSATGSVGTYTLMTVGGNGIVTVPKILSMGNNGNRKEIVLWEAGTSTDVNSHHFAGFGLGSSQMLYQIDNTNAYHRFYAATSSTTSNELLSIGGNGIVVVPKILSMGQSGNRKEIVLWEAGSSTDTASHLFAGFGLGSSQMLYQIDSTAADHVFYAATSSTTSNELLRIGGNGVVNIPGNLNLATSGGTPSNLNYYEEYTHTTTFTGPATTSTLTFYITRIGRVVTMSMETSAGTSGSAGNTHNYWTSTTAIPSRFRGWGYSLIKATNNYVETTAYISVRADNGLMEISLLPTTTYWNGGIAIYGFSVTWRV